MLNSNAFNVVTKPIGSLCNLDCSYCFYLEKEKLYPANKRWRMSNEVLENFIRQYINTQKVDEITFVWQGGEPTLLGVEFFMEVVKLQEEYSDGKIINNSFQTNGILLDDEWGSFFSEHGFLIGISIDGPKEIHDRFRRFRGGQDSFEKVLNGLEVLRKHHIDFNTVTCVHSANSYKPLEIYHFLKEIGSKFMQFIPIVERISFVNTNTELNLVSPDYTGKAAVTDWSVAPLQFGLFLSSIFDEWIRTDVGKYFIQIFDLSLEAWAGQVPGLCVFQETCGNALAIEHNGDLYSCDHYVYPINKLGNIKSNPLQNMVNSDQQNKFGLDKKMRLPNYCIKCEYRFICNGECPKHRFTDSPDGEPGFNYLCSGYKHFFNHIDPYMEFMAHELGNGRAPSNVMQWKNEKDNESNNIK